LFLLESKPVNTISKTQNGKLIGWNTDIIGFDKAINMVGEISFKNPIGIIGSGQMSKMIQDYFNKHAIEYLVINNRDYDGYFPLEGLSGLINCTPFQNYNLECLPQSSWVMDLGYKDDTFIKNARARGHFAFNGMGMLIAQAEESQRIWKS
jgi:shikimate 5-dehydrogenase